MASGNEMSLTWRKKSENVHLKYDFVLQNRIMEVIIYLKDVKFPDIILLVLIYYMFLKEIRLKNYI